MLLGHWQEKKALGQARSALAALAELLPDEAERVGYRKMIQNLVWAAGYNVLAIPLAAGALAWAGITLPPAVGAVLMSASTIVVALNAQLLRRLDLRRPAPVTA
jgi:cation transport ATPase